MWINTFSNIGLRRMVKAIWKNGAFLKILFLTENKQLQKTYQDEFVKGNLLNALAEVN